jgi:hypothetical protein
MGYHRERVEACGTDAHLSTALEAFALSVTTERVELGTIGQYMGRRSIGAFLLILALPMALPIPAPGLSVAVISAQLLLGRHSAWLPRRLARRSIARSELITLVTMGLPALRALERIVRPRASWMAGDWAMIPVGAICLVLAVIITLPIPLGHMVPGAAISVLALGLIERDGLAIGIGLLAALLGLTIVTLASTGLVAALRG